MNVSLFLRSDPGGGKMKTPPLCRSGRVYFHLGGGFVPWAVPIIMSTLFFVENNGAREREKEHRRAESI